MEQNLNSAISKFLRVQRNIRDLTQHELADLVGVKRVNYCYYELHGRIALDVFIKIMLALKIDFNELGVFILEWDKEEKERLAKQRDKESFEKLMAENEEFLSRYNL
jgi:transcriptional regulator with XRE-family HTH domain